MADVWERIETRIEKLERERDAWRAIAFGSACVNSPWALHIQEAFDRRMAAPDSSRINGGTP